MIAVLPVLLGRCEANLQVAVSDGVIPDAANLRKEVLDGLMELLVMDGSGDDLADELDFYECKSNVLVTASEYSTREEIVSNAILAAPSPNYSISSMPSCCANSMYWRSATSCW